MCVDKPLKQGKYVIADATKIAMGKTDTNNSIQ